MILKSCVSRTTGIMITVLLGSIIFLASCFKKEKFDKIEIDPLNHGWGLPIIDSELSLGDVIRSLDSTRALTENPDKSYTFTYFDTLSSQTAESYFRLADQQVSETFTLPAGAPLLLPANTPYSNSVQATEAVSLAAGSEIKSILFKQGEFTASFSTTLKHNVTAKLTIADLKKDNAPFTHSFTSTFSNGNIVAPPARILNLDGYNLDLTKGNTTTNTLTYTIDYTITGTGQPILPSDNFTLEISLKTLRFKNMIGNLSAITSFENFNASTKISIFDNALDGNVFFEGATVAITADNSFGIPITMDIQNLQTTTAYAGTASTTRRATTTNAAQNFSLTDGNGNATVGAPALAQINSSKLTLYELRKDNSNVEEMIRLAPNKLSYNFIPRLTAGNDQFITDQSKLRLYVKVTIPIFAKLEKYVLGDTLGVDKFPARSGDNWRVDSVRLRFKTTNSIPLDSYTQLYFLDSLGRKIDSLITNPGEFIKRPVINAQGQAIQPTEMVTIVQMAGERYDNIMSRTKNLYMMSRLLTSKNQNEEQIFIKFFSTNKLRLEISALAIGQVTIKVNK